MSLDCVLPVPNTPRAKAALFSHLSGEDHGTMTLTRASSSFVFTSKRYPKAQDSHALLLNHHRPMLDPGVLKAHANGAVDSELFTLTAPGFTPFPCFRFDAQGVVRVARERDDDEFSDTCTLVSDSSSDDGHDHSDHDLDDSVPTASKPKWSSNALVNAYIAKNHRRSRMRRSMQQETSHLFSDAFKNEHLQCL